MDCKENLGKVTGHFFAPTYSGMMCNSIRRHLLIKFWSKMFVMEKIEDNFLPSKNVKYNDNAYSYLGHRQQRVLNHYE